MGEAQLVAGVLLDVTPAQALEDHARRNIQGADVRQLGSERLFKRPVDIEPAPPVGSDALDLDLPQIVLGLSVVDGKQARATARNQLVVKLRPACLVRAAKARFAGEWKTTTKNNKKNEQQQQTS